MRKMSNVANGVVFAATWQSLFTATISMGLLRTTSMVSINTLLSRILGFVRDMICAYYFGASGEFDAFMVAFRIPNFFRRLFAEGAFSQAFVPIFSEYRLKRKHRDVRIFINHVFGLLSLSVFIFVAIALFAAPLIIRVFAPGFTHHDPRLALSTGMLYWTFPYLFFITLTAVCASILNSYDYFGIPSFTPILLNIVLILCAIFLRRYFHIPIYSLAVGVFIAGILQFGFQLPFLKRRKLLPWPKLSLRDKGVRRVLALLVPALVGVSVAQISVLIDTVFASFLKTGSVSWLYYSDRITQLPLGIFGIAIATVILPKLSKHHASGQYNHYSQTLDWALRLLLLIGLPATLGLLFLAGPILSTLFQSGHFDTHTVIMTQKSLITFSIGLEAFMCIKVLASGFYSRQDIKTPVKIAIIAVIVNLLVNFLLIKPMAHAGLALSTSISSWVNALMLLTLLIKQKIYQWQPGWLSYALKLLFAAVLMSLFLGVATSPLAQWTQSARLWRVEHLTYLLAGASGIYFIGLWISGVRIRHFRMM